MPIFWIRSIRVKIANFSSFFCLSIPKRDLDTKETTKRQRQLQQQQQRQRQRQQQQQPQQQQQRHQQRN